MMKEGKDSIAEIAAQEEEKRFKLLNMLYELGEGKADKDVEVYALTQRTLLTDREHRNALNYLEQEGLLEFPYDEEVFVRLTHQGRKEIEQALRKPPDGTEHFTTQVIQNFHGPVYGAVQGGGQGNTQQVSVSIDSQVDQAIIDLIAALRASALDEFKKDDAIQAAESLKKLTEKPKTPELLERAKTKIEQLKSIITNSVAVMQTVAPYWPIIENHFRN
jgi:DNA-binding MarR family transcriptional regulator